MLHEKSNNNNEYKILRKLKIYMYMTSITIVLKIL